MLLLPLLPLLALALALVPSAAAVPVAILPAASLPSGNVTRQVVNLDLPPLERWQAFAGKYNESLRAVTQMFNALVPAKYQAAAEALAADLDGHFGSEAGEEMRGIALATGMPLGEIVILNLSYELTAYCTSITARDASGKILHGRNLDYSYSWLKNLTVELDFQRGGQTAFKGTSFVGYVGLLTGMLPGSHAVSLDERDQGNVWENAFAALAENGKALGMTIRETFEQGMSFDEAVSSLQKTHFIAPAYIIVSGTQGNEGVVITRDRFEPVNTWPLTETDWFHVETNYDHWVAPPQHDDRRDPANKAMNAIGQAGITPAGILSVIAMPPVLNDGTIYSAIMVPADGTYVSYAR